MAASIPRKLENGIEFSGWRITSDKKPISNSKGREKYVRTHFQSFA